MLTLATISDQSDIHLGMHGWLILLGLALVSCSAFNIGREIGRSEVRRAILRHPSLRARHDDKRFRQAA